MCWFYTKLSDNGRAKYLADRVYFSQYGDVGSSPKPRSVGEIQDNDLPVSSQPPKDEKLIITKENIFLNTNKEVLPQTLAVAKVIGLEKKENIQTSLRSFLSKINTSIGTAKRALNELKELGAIDYSISKTGVQITTKSLYYNPSINLPENHKFKTCEKVKVKSQREKIKDLILNKKEKQFLVSNNSIKNELGLASVSKVQDNLQKLANEGLINIEKTTHGTKITVLGE